MSARLAIAIPLLWGAFTHGLSAQDVTARLNGRVPPDVARAVAAIAQDAAARGIPVEPLVEKAIEGSAKQVPGPRVIAAVRALVTRLDDARITLRDAGVSAPSAAVIEGGADALNAGLSKQEVGELAHANRPPYDLAVTLRVAATLTALHVPTDRAVKLMRTMIAAGRAPAELLELPGEVQQEVTHGASPAEAADGAEQGVHGGQEGHTGDTRSGAEDATPQSTPSSQVNPHRP